MCRTDITEYYASVSVELLGELLLERRCKVTAIDRFMRILKFWQTTCGLAGLPIGPEASAVVGNFFLDPVDRTIIAAGVEHRRYGDDILILCEEKALSEAVVALLDDRLSSLQLTRSEEKTKPFDDPEEAKENLRDAKFDYWESVSHFPKLAAKAVERAFDQELLDSDQINPSRFRWIIRYLKNKGNTSRCYDLVRRPHLMNVDPKESCAYLKLVRSDNRVSEECMKLVSRPTQPHFEALTFHTLLAMSRVRTSRAAAKQFESIAIDKTRPWPTRAAAWCAVAKSDGTKPSFLMEAAREEKEPNIRRAIVTTLRRFASDRRCNSFLRHSSEMSQMSRYTLEWVKKAA